MIDGAGITGILSEHGIALLAPIAVLEGPIVSVIAGWLASRGILVLWQVIVCVIVADVVGDVIMYGVGHGMLGWLPARWLERLGITESRLAQMAGTFADKGVRVLVIGKLTHAAGFAVLMGAGAARMPLVPFILANFLASIPKALLFVAIGYLFGSAHEAIGHWLSVGSAVLLALLVGGVVIWFRRRKARS